MTWRGPAEPARAAFRGSSPRHELATPGLRELPDPLAHARERLLQVGQAGALGA